MLSRDYSERKLTENVECEIMHVVVEEAHESYRYSMKSSRFLHTLIWLHGAHICRCLMVPIQLLLAAS